MLYMYVFIKSEIRWDEIQKSFYVIKISKCLLSFIEFYKH